MKIYNDDLYRYYHYNHQYNELIEAIKGMSGDTAYPEQKIFYGRFQLPKSHKKTRGQITCRKPKNNPVPGRCY